MRQRRQQQQQRQLHQQQQQQYDGDNGHHRRRRAHALGAARVLFDVAVLLVSVSLLAVGVVRFAQRLPPPLPATAPASTFAEERAIAHLYELERIGRSMMGTKPNERAAKYIEAQLDQIATAAATAPTITVEVDYHRSSGSMYFDILGHGMTNVYSNLTNVIAKVTFNGGGEASGDGDNGGALLVNAHFDTAVGSEGSMDDRASCAAMIEVLRALVDTEIERATATDINGKIELPPTPTRPLVLLFNGAEETLQEASHAFVTQHPWAKGISGVYNLDAAGTTGPEVLFQSGDAAWPLAFGAAVPYPSGFSLAQDIFSTGVLHSDTDYRIFRDFGNITGLDLALVQNSWAYHTILDRVENSVPGTIQHIGDNLLAFARYVLREDVALLDFNTTNPQYGDTAVYFDVLRLWFFAYTKSFALLLHVIVAVLGLVAVGVVVDWNWGRVARALLSTIATAVVAIVAAVVAGLAASIVKPMMWYASPEGAVVAMLFLLVLTVVVAFKKLFYYHFSSAAGSDVDGGHRDVVIDVLVGTTTMYLLIMALLTVGNVSSAYVFMILSVASIAAVVVAIFSGGISSGGDSTRSPPPLPLLINYVVLVAPTVFLVPFVWPFLCLFAALMGRGGFDTPADILVAVLHAVCLTPHVLGALLLYARVHQHTTAKVARGARAALVTATVAALLLLLLRPSYTRERPKRVLVQHAHRVDDHQSYLYVASIDARGAAETVAAIRDRAAVLLAEREHGVPAAARARDAGGAAELDTAALRVLADSDAWQRRTDAAEFDILFPASYFMDMYRVRAPPVGDYVPPVQLNIDGDATRGGVRTINVTMEYVGSEFVHMRVHAPLLPGSLHERGVASTSRSSAMPLEDVGAPNTYFARHIGNRGVHTWHATLHVNATADATRVGVRWSGMRLAPSTHARRVLDLLPPWATPVGVSGVYGSTTL